MQMRLIRGHPQLFCLKTRLQRLTTKIIHQCQLSTKTTATSCSAFKEFLKEHEKRMKRSREIPSEIKKKGDKRRRKAVAEAEELVSLRFYSCVVRTFFLLM